MKFYIACGIYLELDKEWGFELGNSVIDDSEIDNGDLIEVVRSIRRGCDIFENRLENIYQKMFENAEESGVMAELTELVKSYLYDDKDKVKKYCELIIGGCNDVYCYLEIANCLANDVEDKEWARKIYEDALYDCENGEDRERVIEDIEYYLDEDWAAELREDG